MDEEVRSKKVKVKGSQQLSAVSNQKNSDSRRLLADSQFNNYSFFCLILLSFLFFMSNCSDNFQALEENDQYHFSIYGYLDASADTQWVRVSPAREQVQTMTEVPEMTVTVENMDTGETIVMKDSLFQQGGVYFLNFWTTEPIEHNQSYRLVAEKPTGEKSQAIAEVPGELPNPLVIIQQFFGQPTTYQVLVDKNVHVADVQTKWYVRIHASDLDVNRVFSFVYRNTAETIDTYGDAYSYHLEPEKELEEIEKQVVLPPEGEIEVIYRQIYVASSGSEWSSELSSLDDVTYALPETFSNVENGVGFLTGIDSKYVPYASCLNEGETQIIACPEEEVFW